MDPVDELDRLLFELIERHGAHVLLWRCVVSSLSFAFCVIRHIAESLQRSLRSSLLESIRKIAEALEPETGTQAEPEKVAVSSAEVHGDFADDRLALVLDSSDDEEEASVSSSEEEVFLDREVACSSPESSVLSPDELSVSPSPDASVAPSWFWQ